MKKFMQQGLVQKIKNFLPKKDISIQLTGFLTTKTIMEHIELTKHGSQLRFVPQGEISGVCITGNNFFLDDIAFENEPVALQLTDRVISALRNNESVFIERYVIQNNSYQTLDYYTTNVHDGTQGIVSKKMVFVKQIEKNCRKIISPTLSEEQIKIIDLRTATIQNYIKQAEEITQRKNTFASHYFKGFLNDKGELKPNMSSNASEKIDSFEKRKCFIARKYLTLLRNNTTPESALHQIEKTAKFAAIDSIYLRNKDDVMEMLQLVSSKYNLKLPQQEEKRQAT